MTVNDAADRVANNPVLTALARLAMFLTPILVSVSLFVLGNYMQGQEEAMRSVSSRVTLTEQTGSSLDKRVTVVEDSIARGRPDRLALQDKTETVLDKLASQNSQILAQLAGIVARMDEAEKRR